MIRYVKFITREMVKSNTDVLFVFGDNLARKGFGGQAKAMRGEPNSVGIPTKRYPSMTPESFLYDNDFDEWLYFSKDDIERLFSAKKIVWPLDGIGTGLARLNETSPRIFQYIEKIRKELEIQ